MVCTEINVTGLRSNKCLNDSKRKQKCTQLGETYEITRGMTTNFKDN